MNNLIAIDPGMTGGIACSIGNTVECSKMPETQPDVLHLIRAISARALGPITCYIEDIPKYVGENVPSSAIFVMAENYGYLKGVLQALGIRTIQVTPQKWMKALNLGTKGTRKATPGAGIEERAAIKAHNAQAKRDWKNKLKAEAQRRFPHLAATLKTADALLILEHARIQENHREIDQHIPLALKG